MAMVKSLIRLCAIYHEIDNSLASISPDASYHFRYMAATDNGGHHEANAADSLLLSALDINIICRIIFIAFSKSVRGSSHIHLALPNIREISPYIVAADDGHPS